MVNLAAAFEKYDDEYLKFDRIVNPIHPRPDLCAFLLLDRLSPRPGRDMVSSAAHDEIWLEVDPERLADVASDDDVLTLVRCGVRFDADVDSFAMFV